MNREVGCLTILNREARYLTNENREGGGTY